MNKPTLYYALFSPPSRSCIIAAKLIGLDIELRSVDYSKREHFSEEFLQINPLHTVPVLIDNGEAICDSHVIMTYMVSKYGKDDALYPKDLIQRARVDQRMYFEDGVLFQVIKDFVNRNIFGDEPEYHPNSIKIAHNAYAFLEIFLEKGYAAGDKMTLADVSIHPTLITLERMVPIEKEKYPRICSWLNRMKSLPDNLEVNEKGADDLVGRILECCERNKAAKDNEIK